MRDWRKWLGSGIGLGAAAVVLIVAYVQPLQGELPFGLPVAEYGGAIQEIVIQYTPEAASLVWPTYRDFLAQAAPEWTVYVVCPEGSAFSDFTRRAGPVSCQLVPVRVAHPLSCWSRDRWLAFAPASAGQPRVIWLPREEQAAHNWTLRSGDAQVGFDLAQSVPQLRAVRSELNFDAGDFACDGSTAFIAPAVLRRNLQQTVPTRADLEKVLRTRFANPVLLEDVPDHHVGMYLMPVRSQTVLVGDPSLALKVLGGIPAPPLCPCGDDFTAKTQAQFDNAARQCESAGYRVVRIPTVPGMDRRTFISYVNVIQDHQRGADIVYLPVFLNAPALNDAAQRVWEELGYQVRRVDCTALYPNFGTLHCVVNVLARAAAPRSGN